MRIMAYRKKVWFVKKIFLIIISLILCACHTTPQLEGTWTCEKSPLENKPELQAETGNKKIS